MPLAFRLAHQVALGINFLHNLSPALLHLDLKPNNVLLDSYLNAKVSPRLLGKTERFAILVPLLISALSVSLPLIISFLSLLMLFSFPLHHSLQILGWPGFTTAFHRVQRKTVTMGERTATSLQRRLICHTHLLELLISTGTKDCLILS